MKIKDIIRKKSLAYLPYASAGIFLVCLIAITIYQTKIPTTTNTYTNRIQQEYMHNVVVTHFTETGVIKDQIYANYWAYLPALGHSTLLQPQIHITKPTGAKWLIQAKHGKARHTTLDSKISKLDLDENVIIKRLADNDFIPITMTTEQISYFPETDFVATDKYVEMDKPGFHLTGIGLKGYLNKDTIQLLKEVKTHYEIAS